MRPVEKAISTLLERNPFYANFFLNATVVYDKYNVRTAGAGLSRNGVTIVLNSKFLDTLTDEEVRSVIEHEVLHILFMHILVDKKSGYNKQIANIAMDASINQWIKELPPDCITLDTVRKVCKEPVEAEQDWEYYYSLLMKYAEFVTEDMSTLDEHDIELGDGVSISEGKITIRTILEKSIKTCKGNIPAHVSKLYGSICGEAQVPWEQVLSNFVSRTISSTTRATRKKISRRFDLHQPGKKKKRELTLGVCVDSSGSISDDHYSAFLTEIQRISKICVTTYVIDADCEVQNVEKVKKNKKISATRHGAGGTAYNPAIKKCKELKCDAIVYFGDFDCADTPENPGIPFLWVGVGESPKPADFGSEVRIK